MPASYRVAFKNEDTDEAGLPLGPVTLYTTNGFDVPYGIERWVTRPEAVALAARFGVALEEH